MDKAKELIIEAVRELRKEKCECDNHKLISDPIY